MRIGLVGGLGVGAAVHYYQALAEAESTAGRELSLAMVHADRERVLRLVTGGDAEGLGDYLLGIAESLLAAGAGCLVIPAVTPHYCARQLEAGSPIPLINILRTTDAALAAAGQRRVAVFGTRFTIESDLFGGVTAAELVRPSPTEIEEIQAIYMRVAASRGVPADRERLTRIAHALIDRDRLDGILLAGTDLSPMFTPASTSFPFVDCAQAHIDEILRRARSV